MNRGWFSTRGFSANLGYLSYYSGGFRVIEVDDGQIEEVGHFIDEGGNNFWGVQTFAHDHEEYVAVSDRDFGSDALPLLHESCVGFDLSHMTQRSDRGMADRGDVEFDGSTDS